MLHKKIIREKSEGEKNHASNSDCQHPTAKNGKNSEAEGLSLKILTEKILPKIIVTKSLIAAQK